MHNIAVSFINEIKQAISQKNKPLILRYLGYLEIELKQIDREKLVPSIRHEFTIISHTLSSDKNFWVNSANHNKLETNLDLLTSHLNTYGILNTSIYANKFSFISTSVLNEIIERDYQELTDILIPDRAWKSSVILSGSILEAILYDQLSNVPYKNLALKCSSAPKYKDKTVKPLEEWKLAEMIIVAEKIDCLPSQRAKSIDQVLRDYRNFVHPLVEIKSQHPCTEAEAYMAKGALDAVINHFNLVKESTISY